MTTTATTRVREIERVLRIGGLRPRDLLFAERGERVMILAWEDADLETAREVLTGAGFRVEYRAGGELRPLPGRPDVLEQDAPTLFVG